MIPTLMQYDNAPPPIREAFAADSPASAEVIAAAMLALGLQLTDGNAVEDLLGDDAWYFNDGIGKAPLRTGLLPRRAAKQRLEEAFGRRNGWTDDPELRLELLDENRERPTTETAAALFELCLCHPEPLVQVASAASYIDVTTDVDDLVAVLVDGVRSHEGLVRRVAATALGRVAPEHPVLDNPFAALADAGGNPGRLESSLIVHGSFARRDKWWQPGGDFHTYIRNNVRPDLYQSRDRFEWSGAYSPAARALAAQELAAWVTQRRGGSVDIFAHSHGGSVAMRATHAALSVGSLVLLSVPVHWSTYFPNFANIGQCTSVRVHADLVILADQGGQRFRDPRITEHVLPIWFNHSATRDPAIWMAHGLDSRI